MNDVRENKFLHKPVMVKEVLEYLQPQPGKIMLDGTVGNGGHACRIINNINPDGLLIGIDKDAEILEIAKQRLAETGYRFELYHADYAQIDTVLSRVGIEKVHGVLLDLGVSSFQLEHADRGFSFSRQGPLDMRMNRSTGKTARDLIQRATQTELERILREYGEERWSRRIAKEILKEEKKVGITSTEQLARVVERAVPKGGSRRRRIHPATRVFQALRIAVNKELESLELFLNKIHNYMYSGGRIVIISFHSLEDRIVKDRFREMSRRGIYRILTKKPVQPSEQEIQTNIRCRSAKLRAAERI